MPNLEKCKVGQFFSMEEDRNKKDCDLFGNFVPSIQITLCTTYFTSTYC